MKQNILFVLALCVSTTGLSQSSEMGDSLRNEGQIEKAIEQYSLAFTQNPEDETNTYNFACAFALNQQVDSAFKYLEIALVEEVNVRTFHDPDFYFLIDDPRWDSLRNIMISRIEDTYGPYGNVELAKELWTMKIKDQAFYYHAEQAESRLIKSAIWEAKKLLNQQNLKRLEEIIIEYGWPTKTLVKGSAATAAFLIVQHADLATQKKYLPMMKEAANLKEADWSSLALLIDRIEMREGRPQIYGSQIRQGEDGTFEVYEIIDPEYVNQRRLEVGLRPIESYVGRWNIEWTIEQKTK